LAFPRALTDLPMHRIDVWRMIRRRATAAGIDADMCCHTFRATGLTNFLANGGTLENAQAMADHASPRTTQLYDRSRSTRSNGSRFERGPEMAARLASRQPSAGNQRPAGHDPEQTLDVWPHLRFVRA
jgi:integrase